MTTIDEIALEIRAQVRAKAGLKPDWGKASPATQDWYRHLAREWAKGHAPEAKDNNRRKVE